MTKRSTIISAFFVIIGFSTAFGQEEKKEEKKIKIYGFIRNDFYYNSRMNIEAADGAFSIFPRPIIENEDQEDINNVPQASLYAIASRVGLDVTGLPVLNAKTSARIEADFVGFGANNHVLRIRQAYAKFNWKSSEILFGQTWHPLFGNVYPTILSLNTGSPFQPFNRSPQLRYTQFILPSLSLIASANYQLQYVSQGPDGSSNSYLKKALLPDMFLGLEYKTNEWITGAGFDVKTIKPSSNVNLSSITAMAYGQYQSSKFQIKGKALLGENLSDFVMPLGYGVSSMNENGKVTSYTNFNIISSWLNVLYGQKYRSGLFLGFMQNLGTAKQLHETADGFIAYGYGFFREPQLMADRIFRISPHFDVSISNISLGLEFEYTNTLYGNLKKDGRVTNSYSVDNKRVVLTAYYNF